MSIWYNDARQQTNKGLDNELLNRDNNADTYRGLLDSVKHGASVRQEIKDYMEWTRDYNLADLDRWARERGLTVDKAIERLRLGRMLYKHDNHKD